MKDKELFNNKKLGIALVGLGKYGTNQIIPALEKTIDCKLTGLVSGSFDKVEEYAQRYAIPKNNIYNYENFDNIKNNKEIDIIYITLPNSMHAEYTIRALHAGKHVICEKPMGISSKECIEMIEASKKTGKQLFVGYRLHYEPFNLKAMEFGQQELKGPVQKIEASFGFEIEPSVWRLNKSMAGGGCLFDVGIYAIQGACYVLGMEPLAIRNATIIKSNDKKFSQVEGDIKWEMEFSNGVIAYCEASYTKEIDRLFIESKYGWMELNPAFYYQDLKGEISEGKLEIDNINQQENQINGIIDCILNKTKNRVPGTMGLRDLIIMEVIYKSAETGKRVELKDWSLKYSV